MKSVMGRHFYHQIDRNQARITEFLTKCGVKVLSLSRMGDGVPDLLCNYRDKLFLVEVKSGAGQLTDKQSKFAEDWPIHLVRDFADCTDLIEELRSQAIA